MASLHPRYTPSLIESKMKNKKFNLQIAVFLIIRTAINTSIRMVGPFLLVFARGLQADMTAMATAVSASMAASAFGPFLAEIADRRGRKTGMLLGLSIYTIGVGLVLVWPAYTAFLLALLLASLGNNIFLPAVQAYVGDRVPYEKRGITLSLLEVSWAGAFIVGVPLVGILIPRAGWQSPFLSLFVLGLLSIACVALLVPKLSAPEISEGAIDRSRFYLIIKTPAALFGLAMGFLIIAGNSMISVIFGAWLEQSYGLEIAAIGAAATVIGFAELAGEGVVAMIADRFGKRKTIAAGFIINILSASLPFLMGSTVTGALIWMFIFNFSFEVTLVASIPLMTEVLPPARATLMAVFLAASSLGMAAGMFMGPRLYTTGGFLINVIAAMLMNALGLLILPRVHRAVPK
ncbi:putative MFS-type transporter YwfA [Leptolinea sp. HRD-7]|nr:putative MFS-type transporter YwfA [Leptolinea sp. HRD-7]